MPYIAPHDRKHFDVRQFDQVEMPMSMPMTPRMAPRLDAEEEQVLAAQSAAAGNLDDLPIGNQWQAQQRPAAAPPPAQPRMRYVSEIY